MQQFQCPRCNAPVAYGAQLCQYCGNQLYWQPQSPHYQQQPLVNQQIYSCPTCRRPVQYGISFCSYCHTPFNWPAQQLQDIPTDTPKKHRYSQRHYESAGQEAKESRRSPWLFGSLAMVLLIMFGGFIAFATGIFPQGTQQDTPTKQQPPPQNPPTVQNPPDTTAPMSILLINDELVRLTGAVPYPQKAPPAPKEDKWIATNKVLYFELQAGDRISVLASMQQPAVVYINLGARAPLTMPNGVREAIDGTLGGYWPYRFDATNPIQLDYIALADGIYFVALMNESKDIQMVKVKATKYPAAPISNK